jgi:SAM-dependent methyltransferase
VADLPYDLAPGLAERLATALDVEAKIPRALDALGPIAGRDVALVDPGEGLNAARLESVGARVHGAVANRNGRLGLPDDAADVVVSCWSAFRGVDPSELAEAERILRSGGRLLVVHDYGRDDVSQLHADAATRPEYVSWSRRDGPFLLGGFKVRVVHCWWTFASVDEARDLVSEAFGAPGRSFASTLQRSRLSYNVAIYHRTFGGAGGIA